MKKKALISFLIMISLLTPIALSEETQLENENTEEATALYNEAIDLYKINDIEKSIEMFRKAIELKPDFYQAHYNLAQILMSVDNNIEAIQSLEAINQIKPNDSENLYNLGKMYYKNGFLSKAFKKLKLIDVNSPQYDSAKLLLNKIEKRQTELNLENKIREHQNILSPQGKLKGVELEEYNAPSGIVADSRGNIYVASFMDNKIHKISIYGQKSVLSKSNLLQGPIGIAADKEDNIYVANYNANNIIKITPTGVASIFADIKKPYCINYDFAHNRLYVTEQDTNKLMKFDL